MSQKIIDLIDDIKDNIPDQKYLEICNELQRLYCKILRYSDASKSDILAELEFVRRELESEQIYCKKLEQILRFVFVSIYVFLVTYVLLKLK